MTAMLTNEEVEVMIEEQVAEARRKQLNIARAPRPIKIFGLDSSSKYAEQVADKLGMAITPHTEKSFEDGECYLKPTSDDVGNVRGHNVFVIQSLYSDNKESVSDKFVKLCVMLGACRQASAHEVTAVIPHLGWARQDRKTESRAPITTKIIAKMLESTGIDRVLLFDVHNLAAEQNAFDVPIDNLETKNLIADWCVERLDPEKPIVALSPDSGGLSRTDRFRVSLMKKLSEKHGKSIEVDIAYYDKIRRSNGELTGGKIIGSVEGCQVVILDDMISTGGTMVKAARCVEKEKGELFALCCTHGLFVGKANKCMSEVDAPIVVADTVLPFRLNDDNKSKISIVDTTKMTADAIWRIHTGTGSISELLR